MQQSNRETPTYPILILRSGRTNLDPGQLLEFIETLPKPHIHDYHALDALDQLTLIVHLFYGR